MLDNNIHPFDTPLYYRMEAFHQKKIDFNVPLTIAIARLKSLMIEEFTPGEILWYFSLYEPFPKWTPYTGWEVLRKSITKNLKRKPKKPVY